MDGWCHGCGRCERERDGMKGDATVSQGGKEKGRKKTENALLLNLKNGRAKVGNLNLLERLKVVKEDVLNLRLMLSLFVVVSGFDHSMSADAMN